MGAEKAARALTEQIIRLSHGILVISGNTKMKTDSYYISMAKMSQLKRAICYWNGRCFIGFVRTYCFVSMALAA